MGELSEKDFINESYRKDPYTFWFWLAIVVSLTLVLWTCDRWFGNDLNAYSQPLCPFSLNRPS